MRPIFLSFVFFFISISLAHALSFQPMKEGYKTGDTFQIEINIPGLVDPLTADNFEFMLQEERLNLGIFFVRIDNEKYFAYFPLPLQEGNYTLLLKNYNVIEEGILKQKTDSYIFSVVEGNGVRVDPGVIDARDNRDLFYININNTGNESLNFQVNSDSNFIRLDERYENVSLLSGEDISLSFSLVKSNINKDSGNILFLDYRIPVLVSFRERTEDIPRDAIRFLDERINLTLREDEMLDGDISFRNFYDEELSDVSFRFSTQLNELLLIEPLFFATLGPGEIKKIHVWVNGEKNAEPGEYSGNLTLISGNIQDDFPIFLKIVEQEVFLPINQSFVEASNISEKKNMTQLPLPKEENKYAWVWAVVALVVIFIGILIFYFLKKKEKAEDVGDLIK